MKPIIGICALMILFFCLKAEAYQHKKAILMVEREAQVDSSGYNFVDVLARNVYSWVKSGEVILWDSPEKKSKISYPELQGVELNTQSFFRTIKSIYIYEYWSSDRKTTSFAVDGISFTGLNYKGNDVIFGFVEYKGALKELCQNTPVLPNANGLSGRTLYSVLMNKEYQYNLIYFDNAPLVKYKTSNRINTDAFNPKKQLLNYVYAKSTKLIEYGWDSLSKEQVTVSHQVIKVLNDFFNDNRQEFFNLGGDKIYSFLKDAPISVTDFYVIETWTKDKDGKIYFTPQTIRLFTKGFELQPVSFQQMDVWKIQINGESLSAFLSAKNFPYTIKKINETMIPYSLAQSYKDALFANSWNRIIINK